MGQMASENGGTLFAVSHSTFLRMLLATLLDISLGEAALLEQRNGCINVLDVNVEGMTETIGPKSNLFGGGGDCSGPIILTWSFRGPRWLGRMNVAIWRELRGL